MVCCDCSRSTLASIEEADFTVTALDRTELPKGAAIRPPCRGGDRVSNVIACAECDRTVLAAVGYASTRSPDNADLSMAAMTSWRRTASAKSGTV